MKILQIGKYYYPYRGGMETVVQTLCEGLVANQVDIQVLCSHERRLEVDDALAGVKVHRMMRWGVLFSQSITPSLLYWVPKLAKEADVVHLHCPNPLAELAALFLPKSVPLVITYHSDVVRQKLLLPFYKPLLRRVLKRADKIIVATENHINYSFILPEFREKCEVIPFGINVERYSENIEGHKIQSAKEKFGTFALFVGRLVGYKGVQFLIEAMKKVNGNLVVVGDGPLMNELLTQIEDNGLEKRVFLLGQVKDDSELDLLFRACECFVLPSITTNEAFGMVQLEAMASKKAVVATNLKSGVPLVGEPNITSFIVEPGNVDQLSVAITRLLESSELAARMGQKGFIRFHDFFTQEKMVSSHIKVYESLLGQTSLKTKKAA
ncbi:MAG: glycosyltransferase [Halobacteriovoraceae bacterium]|nr:glycosyltransferase [Halobacteriovoraceae bacterium]MBT5094278.1 glycosyltransferase [Halobacteriovoraceae bacterium]